jgi:hypothetical protein
MESLMVLSSFYSSGSLNNEKRRADIIKADNGYHVRLYVNDVLVEVRDVSKHSIAYAEDCAENFVEGIFDVDTVSRML